MQETKNFMMSLKVMLKEPFNQTQEPSTDQDLSALESVNNRRENQQGSNVK